MELFQKKYLLDLFKKVVKATDKALIFFNFNCYAFLLLEKIN